MELAGEAQNGTRAIQLFRQSLPDIALVDLRLPDINGIEVTISIRSEFPSAKIIVLTTFEGDVEARRALKAGASGYLLKTMAPSELVEAIRQVYNGKKRLAPEIAASVAEHFESEMLSEREVDVLRQVAIGMGNREIAAILHISEETVKARLKQITEKLGANDRTEAVTIALRRGIMVL
jgi:DNA-binding NarL/FixJ family response regulator